MALLPALLCLFCPACVGVWAPLLGIFGWGLPLGEATHGLLLGASIALSLLVVGLRARRRRYWLPFVVTAFGGGALALGHFLGESVPIAVFGCATLLLGTLLERRSPPTPQEAS
jgi:hypothetical protein